MYQKTMITGRVGSEPQIKESKVGFYIKVPVVCEFHVNGQNTKQWYQCNIYSMQKASLQGVIAGGLLGKGAVVTMTGTHYLINTPQFTGLGFSCNQSDMKVILGANYIQSISNQGQHQESKSAYAPQAQPQQQVQNQQPQAPQAQPDDAPKFYEDDIPY